jgi:hypothetical protein
VASSQVIESCSLSYVKVLVGRSIRLMMTSSRDRDWTLYCSDHDMMVRFQQEDHRPINRQPIGTNPDPTQIEQTTTELDLDGESGSQEIIEEEEDKIPNNHVPSYYVYTIGSITCRYQSYSKWRGKECYLRDLRNAQHQHVPLLSKQGGHTTSGRSEPELV